MNKKQLDKKLEDWMRRLRHNDREMLFAHLTSLKSIYPFNEYEYRLMYLLDKGVITFREYNRLRESYVDASPYLHLYSISPRVFGEIWAQQHLIELDDRFESPSKQVDKYYGGQYDLFLKKGKRIIRVEVKASRAINTKIRGGLETKALAYKSKEPFWMNFQQIKLNIVDVFVFIGVWIDEIHYWVLSNNEIDEHPGRSHQHRGGIEFQIGVTNRNLKAFEQFSARPRNLVKTILDKLK